MAKPFWVTKTGIKIEIEKMTDQHLLNTIRLLRKAYNRILCDDYEIISSYAFASTTPDGASYAAEQEAYQCLDEMENHEFIEKRIPKFKALTEERMKRKLKEIAY